MAAIIPALFAMSSYAATDIEGGNAVVNFHGLIQESTCELDTAASLLDVDMGTINTSAFNGVNSTGSEKDFHITLKNCNAVEDAEGDLTGAYVVFKGDTAGEATTLKTTDNDSVGIQVKQNGKPVALDGSAQTADVNFDASGAATLNFTANYIQVADKVEAGPATAQADFTVYYH